MQLKCLIFGPAMYEHYVLKTSLSQTPFYLLITVGHAKCSKHNSMISFKSKPSFNCKCALKAKLSLNSSKLNVHFSEKTFRQI